MITNIEELKSEVESTLQNTTMRSVDISKGSGVNESSIARYRDGYAIQNSVNLFALAEFFKIEYQLGIR